MKFSIQTAALLAGAVPAAMASPVLEARQGLPQTTVTYATDANFAGSVNTQTFSTLCANVPAEFKGKISSIKNLNPDPQVPGPEFRECSWFTGPDCTGDKLGYSLAYQNVPDLSKVEYGRFDNKIASFQCFRNRRV